MDVNSSSNIKPGAEPVAKEGLENASQAPYYCVPPHSPSSLSSNEYQYESSRNAVLESQRHELATMMNLAEIDLQRRISDQGRTIARIQVLKAQRDGLFSRLRRIEDIMPMMMMTTSSSSSSSSAGAAVPLSCSRSLLMQTLLVCE
mmetsp:Transcript_28893/g.49021  ORF Transcript_28893/g.49021 Transcript_28893/m.49021 type:complete len:146 (+) Transcript_28893:767-1204(+)